MLHLFAWGQSLEISWPGLSWLLQIGFHPRLGFWGRGRGCCARVPAGDTAHPLWWPGCGCWDTGGPGAVTSPALSLQSPLHWWPRGVQWGLRWGFLAAAGTSAELWCVQEGRKW